MPLITHVEPANPVEQLRIWTSFPGGSRRLIIVASNQIYAQVHAHAVAALPDETAGFLLGRAGYDNQSARWHLTIEKTMPIETTEADHNSFQFTWRAVAEAREIREARGLALLGWYHTHPDHEICLSRSDLEKTHRVLFGEPFQVALVYDPVRNRAGYFFWEGRQAICAERAAWREFRFLDREDDHQSDVETPASRSEIGEGKPACSRGREAL